VWQLGSLLYILSGKLRDAEQSMSFFNENEIDRVVRVAVGLVLLALGWSGVVDNLWGIAFKLFGWYPLITGAIGWCPFYALFDFDTRRNSLLKSDRGR
jgi:hypothetical protein